MTSVSGAGDVNGDGLADLIVGAYGDDPNGPNSGASTVVFGKTDGTAVELSDIEASSNSGGFVINGASEGDVSGWSVSGAGDVNGDGLDDLIVGAKGDSPNGDNSGASTVVFGKADGTPVELSDIEANSNSSGFVINGVSAGDVSGWSVNGAGDVNGDGLADLIVGAYGDDPNGPNSGASTVVFGKTDGTAVELSDIEASSNSGGFVINGASEGDVSGWSVSGAGDVNGDGLDDLIVGAKGDSPNGDNSGASTVVFGKADGTPVELSAIASSSNAGGFVINGVSAEDESGFTVSGAGDVNGDGLADLIVGTPFDDPNGADSGATFVVFGKTDGTTVELSDIEAESSSSASTSTITTPQKIGSEFQVNTYTTGDQSQNEITSLSGGGFVVTWMSNAQDGSGKGVYGQLYDSAGNKLNNEFSINTEVTSDQAQPSITGLKDGGFVVAWESTGQDGSGDGVYGQRYDASGNAVGTEFQINTHTSNEQRDVHLASLKDGSFVANWISYNQDGNIWGIFGQRFDSSGNTAGSEFRINTNTANNQQGAQISSLPDGGFIALFGSDSSNHAEPDTSSFGAYGQRYDASGNAVGTEFRINTTTAGHQYYANAAGLKDGNYVIAWSSYGQDGSGGHGIYGQIYDASGNVVKSEFLINTHTSNDQHYASVASLDDGGFFVTWQSEGQDGSKKGVYGQRFDSAGTKVGSELQINSTTNNDQERPSVTTLTDGKLVVAWSSDAQDGNNKGVFAQMFSAGTTSTTSSRSSAGPSIKSSSNALTAIKAIDTAIKTVNTQRSELGAISNRLSHTVNNLTNISSNLSAAKGVIEDADFAQETSNLAKNQILQQASTAMLAQANASKQNVLSLLQG